MMVDGDEDAPAAAPPRVAPPMMVDGDEDAPAAAPPRVAPPMLLDPALAEALESRPTVQADPPPDPTARPDPTALPGAELPEGAPPPPVDLGDASVSFLDGLRSPAPPAPAPAPPLGSVVVVDEDDWQLELGRRARLRLVGWMVARTVRVGNHAAAQVVLPENRADPEQRFSPADYFSITSRGTRLAVERVSAGGEGLLLVDGQPQARAAAAAGLALEVVRRDALGAEDFRIRLHLQHDPQLPDPRAHRLVLDDGDRMVRAMFTKGLPLHAPRRLSLGPISVALTWTGDVLELADYATGYQRPDGGWWPFFVQQDGARFRTVPEDGRLVVLRPGDVILAGSALYRVEAD